MLRNLLLAAAGIGFIAALAGTFSVPDSWPVALMSLLVLFGIAVERFHYHGSPDSRANADWRTTGERFRDPESGQIVEVDYDPETGKRRYRELK